MLRAAARAGEWYRQAWCCRARISAAQLQRPARIAQSPFGEPEAGTTGNDPRRSFLLPAQHQGDRQLVASMAAHMSWANTEDRTARTASGRAAFERRFLDEADGDSLRAEHLRKAYYRRLALKSAQARRKIKILVAEAAEAEAELRAGGDTG